MQDPKDIIIHQRAAEERIRNYVSALFRQDLGRSSMRLLRDDLKSSATYPAYAGVAKAEG